MNGVGRRLQDDGILYDETRSNIDSDDDKIFTPPMDGVGRRLQDDDVLYHETRSSVNSDDQKTFTPPIDSVTGQQIFRNEIDTSEHDNEIEFSGANITFSMTGHSISSG